MASSEYWSTEEKRKLRALRFDPVRVTPAKLKTLAFFFKHGGKIYSVKQYEEPVKASPQLARKIQRATAEGKLDWLIPIEMPDPSTIPPDVMLPWTLPEGSLFNEAGVTRFEYETDLRMAISLDMECDYSEAITLATQLVEQTGHIEDICISAKVRLATFYDHCGMFKPALDLLKELHTALDGRGRHNTREYYWATYQLGVIEMHAGATEKSVRQLLTRVNEHGCADQKVAAWHQLGVLDYRKGRYNPAESKFHDCLEIRKRTGDINGYLYEHRGLANIRKAKGRDLEARAIRDRIVQLARGYHFERYALAIEGDS